jgi:hypothetical protein
MFWRKGSWKKSITMLCHRFVGLFDGFVHVMMCEYVNDREETDNEDIGTFYTIWIRRPVFDMSNRH